MTEIWNKIKFYLFHRKLPVNSELRYRTRIGDMSALAERLKYVTGPFAYRKPGLGFLESFRDLINSLRDITPNEKLHLMRRLMMGCYLRYEYARKNNDKELTPPEIVSIKRFLKYFYYSCDLTDQSYTQETLDNLIIGLKDYNMRR